MNTIYRIIWNAVTGRWVVASEFAKGRKKKGRDHRALISSTFMTGAFGVMYGLSGASHASIVVNANGSTNQAVTYDHNSDGTTSVTMNPGGDPTVIHNVGPGTASTDAATVGQVQNMGNWAKSYTDQQVRAVGKQASAGTAAAMAMTSIPQASLPSQHSFGAGVGNFQGQSSVAVGLSAMNSTGRFAVKFNASATARGDLGVGMGAGVFW